MTQQYLDTVGLMLRVAPFVFESGLFALKGGTAINLFRRDLPRLSVDLDLVFIDRTCGREEALGRIKEALMLASGRLSDRGFEIYNPGGERGNVTKLFARSGSVEVKVEVNPVFRGTIEPIAPLAISSAAAAQLSAHLELPIVSDADLFGSKLVAALDRQHPRDFFDVAELRQSEGIRADIQAGFVIYLAGHNRPVHEVLLPSKQDISASFKQTFVGMTRQLVPLDYLIDTQEWLLDKMSACLTTSQREFLLSLVAADPSWDLVPCKHARDLPALQWKLINLRRLRKRDLRKFAEQRDVLHELLA